MKRPKNLREAIDIAKILSDSNNSPLANIIEGISDNTTLALSAQIKTEENGTIEKVVQSLLMKAGLGNALNTTKNFKSNYLDSIEISTPVDKSFTDFHLLTSTTGERKTSSIDEVVISIKDLYEYLDVLNISVEKGVELPSNDSLFQYRAEVNRLPSPFREMFDQFSDFILNKSLDEMNERIRLTKEEQEAKEQKQKEEQEAKEQKQKEEALIERQRQETEQAQRRQEENEQREANLLNSLEKQLAPLTVQCQEVLKQGYPFTKNASKEVNINLFTKVFGQNGNYMSFLNLTPEVSNLAGVSTLSEVVERGGKFKKFQTVSNVIPINQTYFSGLGNRPWVDFSIKVINLDKDVDKLIIEHNKKKYVYSHGPIIPINLSWPISNDSPLSSLTTFKGKDEVGSIKERGDWSIFRLIEDGKIIKQSNREMILSYELNGKNVTLSLTTDTPINPFNLELLRSFRCP